MKTELTNVDIYCVVEELQQIINGKLDKAFLVNSTTGKELILKIHIPEMGTREIAIGIGKSKYITLTEYNRVKPRNPPSFAMLLRKHLKNIKIVSVEQHNFDRIVKIKFQWNEVEYILVIELFGEGNVILLNKENTIILPLHIERWSTRKIVPKEIYKFPPQRDLTPFNLKYSIAKEIFIEEFQKEDNKSVECVRIISRIFGLAGIYSEEICKLSNIDKSLKNLTIEQINNLYDGVKLFFDKLFNNRKPHIVLKEDKYYSITPIELLKYEDYKKKYYDDFLTAIDDYFSINILKTEIKKKESKIQKSINRQERILNNQIQSLKKYEKQEIENKIKGDLIYGNYMLVDEVLNTLKQARDKLSWKEIKKIINENKEHPILGKVVLLNDKTGEITLKLTVDYGDGNPPITKNIILDLRKNAFENSEEYYKKSKKFKNKIKGVKIAIELSKQKLNNLKKQEEKEIENTIEEEQTVLVKKERKKRKWYEKFKWTVINNYLIIAGKDASTNESIIKRYTEKDDIVFHTQMAGAPFTVIKVDKSKNKLIEQLTEEERTYLLNETAKFAVSHSKAWKLGLGSADVYWVKPDQVSKTAESGEYLSKGAFMIRGKRNFIRSAILDLGIGIINYENEKKITTAPTNVLKSSFEKFVILKPAKKKKGELIKELKKEFIDYSVDDEDILKVLPPGDSDIIK